MHALYWGLAEKGIVCCVHVVIYIVPKKGVIVKKNYPATGVGCILIDDLCKMVGTSSRNSYRR